MVQRYMSLPTLKKAQWSVAIFTVGIILFISVCCFAGLLVYDFYKECDPLSSGLVTVNIFIFFAVHIIFKCFLTISTLYRPLA